MINKELAKIFDTFADIHEIIEDENSKFKIRAYRQASQTLQNFGKDIKDAINIESEEFTENIPGFGPAIRFKTVEYIKTGKVQELEELKSLIPNGLLEILDVKNVGPKKVKKFYEELNITNIEELKQGILDKKVEELAGMGKKSAEKILEAIENFEEYSKRTSLGKVYFELQELIAEFKKCKDVLKVELAGSSRRFQETIGDIDVLGTGKPENHAKIIEFYTQLPQIKQIEAQGETKVTARLHSNIQIDLRVVKPDEFGAALQYFSGNQAHNVKLRTLAKQKGYKISEYGIYKTENDTEIKVGGEKEEEIYTTLGLQYIPVFLRQGNNEIDLASQNKIPTLIETADIKGDLHTHSTYSDGENTIEEMALRAIEKGYEYIAITDHSQSLKVANGLSIERLRFKKAEIEKLKQKLNFPILYGTEVDILADGSLDYADEILAEFDVVVASIHQGLNNNTTERIVKAMNNKHVHIIGHPTTRLINKREPADLDFKQIFKTAQDTKTILEINAQPTRLDLADIYIREAIESYHLVLSINTDAHSLKGLDYMDFGVQYAKRGWTQKENILNTQTYQELQKTLKQKTN
jgi:DNA polymerase (family 10)